MLGLAKVNLPILRLRDIESVSKIDSNSTLGGLEVPCAPKGFDFEFPVIRTTKLVVETRVGT